MVMDGVTYEQMVIVNGHVEWRQSDEIPAEYSYSMDWYGARAKGYAPGEWRTPVSGQRGR
jgi:hypothetical protein